MTISWLNSALKDLDSIYNYYALKNAKTAANMYNAILDETERLTTFPTLAPVEPLLEGMKYEFRSLVVQSGLYKIIYFILGKKIYIYRIWDCRQNPKKIRKR